MAITDRMLTVISLLPHCSAPNKYEDSSTWEVEEAAPLRVVAVGLAVMEVGEVVVPPVSRSAAAAGVAAVAVTEVAHREEWPPLFRLPEAAEPENVTQFLIKNVDIYYLQSIPEKDLQGFCFQDSHIALSTQFSWQVE